MTASQLDAHDEAAARLAGLGLRYTARRRQVVDALLAADGPRTLPALLGEHPELTQSSAYRNLVELTEAGVVRRVTGVGDFAHFELAEPLHEHHHHLVCGACGAIADVALDAGLERRMAAAFDQVATATGFRVDGHSLDITGTCADCST